MLPLSSIQEALFNQLAASLAPVPVLDRAGPNQAFPYVTLGELVAGQNDTLNEEAIDVEATVHVWSRQGGMKELELLMEKAKNALDRQRLPVEGFQWVTTIWEYAQTLRDIDGSTRHGILRFRVLTFSESGGSPKLAETKLH